MGTFPNAVAALGALPRYSVALTWRWTLADRTLELDSYGSYPRTAGLLARGPAPAASSSEPGAIHEWLDPGPALSAPTRSLGAVGIRA